MRIAPLLLAYALVPAHTATAATVSGTVRDLAGNPLEGVQVQALGETVYTDAAGSYDATLDPTGAGSGLDASTWGRVKATYRTGTGEARAARNAPPRRPRGAPSVTEIRMSQSGYLDVRRDFGAIPDGTGYDVVLIPQVIPTYLGDADFATPEGDLQLNGGPGFEGMKECFGFRHSGPFMPATWPAWRQGQPVYVDLEPAPPFTPQQRDTLWALIGDLSPGNFLVEELGLEWLMASMEYYMIPVMEELTGMTDIDLFTESTAGTTCGSSPVTNFYHVLLDNHYAASPFPGGGLDIWFICVHVQDGFQYDPRGAWDLGGFWREFLGGSISRWGDGPFSPEGGGSPSRWDVAFIQLLYAYSRAVVDMQWSNFDLFPFAQTYWPPE